MKVTKQIIRIEREASETSSIDSLGDILWQLIDLKETVAVDQIESFKRLVWQSDLVPLLCRYLDSKEVQSLCTGLCGFIVYICEDFDASNWHATTITNTILRLARRSSPEIGSSILVSLSMMCHYQHFLNGTIATKCTSLLTDLLRCKSVEVARPALGLINIIAEQDPDLIKIIFNSGAVTPGTLECIAINFKRKSVECQSDSLVTFKIVADAYSTAYLWLKNHQKAHRCLQSLISSNHPEIADMAQTIADRIEALTGSFDMDEDHLKKREAAAVLIQQRYRQHAKRRVERRHKQDTKRKTDQEKSMTRKKELQANEKELEETERRLLRTEIKLTQLLTKPARHFRRLDYESLVIRIQYMWRRKLAKKKLSQLDILQKRRWMRRKKKRISPQSYVDQLWTIPLSNERAEELQKQVLQRRKEHHLHYGEISKDKDMSSEVHRRASDMMMDMVYGRLEYNRRQHESESERTMNKIDGIIHRMKDIKTTSDLEMYEWIRDDVFLIPTKSLSQHLYEMNPKESTWWRNRVYFTSVSNISDFISVHSKRDIAACDFCITARLLFETVQRCFHLGKCVSKDLSLCQIGTRKVRLN
ncbi:hypothetical protein PROFUN_14620 [Planoprotostelium fungivorum]|uniref:Uncharacterized protein n=1 Tax=Planoprotostelium fungivorum TaxID=1890364 RepID=A0A2P6N940_9EUKA|nr:hypothetical protein PROFUN_14620 [Planoprotostelium fungivorum]